MKRIVRFAVFAIAVSTGAVCASTAPSPYVDQKNAAIKALSAAEQSALLDGQGMGFAKAAELNGYPGPRHVLDLAQALELTPSQQVATQELFERMRADARRTGTELVAAENALDSLYATRVATSASVNAQLAKIEGLRARLRGIHLNAHLEQAALLTSQQADLYSKLRGYTAGDAHQPSHHGH
jgi:Spy/CpxP family protein refolding chaperone